MDDPFGGHGLEDVVAVRFDPGACPTPVPIRQGADRIDTWRHVAAFEQMGGFGCLSVFRRSPGLSSGLVWIWNL